VNLISVIGLAEDGTTTTYTVTVTRKGASSPSSIKSISTTATGLSPAFSPEILEYSATVRTGILSVKLGATFDASVTVTINGETATSTVSKDVSLVSGTNTITIISTGLDSSISTYVVTVTFRAISSDSTLEGFSTTSGCFTTVFSPSNTGVYTINITYGQPTTVIYAIFNDRKTMTVSDRQATNYTQRSGFAYTSSLNTGSNLITIIVTAEDSTTTSYTFNFIRAVSTNTYLQSLTASNGTLSPSFSPGTYAYSFSVANTVTSTTLKATFYTLISGYYSYAFFASIGSVPLVRDVFSDPIALNYGVNRVTIRAVAESGATKDTIITITRSKLSQTITFASLTGIAYGASPETLSATSTSSLSVAFTSTTSSVCTVLGTTITVLAAGTCTVAANQVGDSSYSAAAPVTQNLVITGASQTITFSSLADITYGSSPAILSATSTSALSVAFTSTTSSVCTVLGTTITILAAGTCTIAANQVGDGSYAPAAQVSQNLIISKVNQTITFASLSGVAYGGVAPAALSATSSSALSVAFTSTTSSVCTVLGTTITVLAAGTCTIVANQAGDGSYAAATQVSQNLVVGKASQSALTISSTAGNLGSSLTLVTSGGTSSGAKSYVVADGTATGCSESGGALTVTGVGTCTVTATMAGGTSYNDVSSTATTITFAHTSQTITFPSITGITYGASPATLSATSSSSLSVAFTSTTSSVCTVLGTTITILTGGTCTVAANQAGDSSYAPAAQVSQNLVISKASQTALTITSIAGIVNNSLTLTTSGGSGNGAVTYAVNSGSCTVSLAVLSNTAAGTCSVTATKASNSSYNAISSSATDVVISGFAVSFTSSGTGVASLNFIGSPLVKPTDPTRTGYTFTGWQDSASNAIAWSYSPGAPITLIAQWRANAAGSLDTLNMSDLTIVATLYASNSLASSITSSTGSSSVSVTIAQSSLPAGTQVNIYSLATTDLAKSVISPTNTYIVSLVVSWGLNNGLMPVASPPIQMTIVNSQILRGAKIYGIVGSTSILLATATVDGTVTLPISTDPVVVVSTSAPDAPTGVSATNGANASSVVTWSAPASDNGSKIIGYTATSSGGQSCATASTSCTVSGLTNGTAYTFNVVATNSLGSSGSSAASTAITPAAPVVTPVVPSGGGSSTPDPAIAAAEAAAARVLAKAEEAAAKAEADAAKASTDRSAADAKAAADKVIAAAKATADAKVIADKAVADAKAVADKAVADAKATADKAIADAKAEADAKVTADKAAADAKVTADKAAADAKAVVDAKVVADKAEANAKVAADKAIADARAVADAKIAADSAAAKVRDALAATSAAATKAAADATKLALDSAKAIADVATATKAAADKASADAAKLQAASDAAAKSAADAKLIADAKASADAKAVVDAKTASDKAASDKSAADAKALSDAKAAVDAKTAADKAVVDKAVADKAAADAAVISTQKNVAAAVFADVAAKSATVALSAEAAYRAAGGTNNLMAQNTIGKGVIPNTQVANGKDKFIRVNVLPPLLHVLSLDDLYNAWVSARTQAATDQSASVKATSEADAAKAVQVAAQKSAADAQVIADSQAKAAADATALVIQSQKAAADAAIAVVNALAAQKDLEAAAILSAQVAQNAAEAKIAADAQATLDAKTATTAKLNAQKITSAKTAADAAVKKVAAVITQLTSKKAAPITATKLVYAVNVSFTNTVAKKLQIAMAAKAMPAKSSLICYGNIQTGKDMKSAILLASSQAKAVCDIAKAANKTISISTRQLPVAQIKPAIAHFKLLL
jgi:uncharacterized repeat protein (TIGR02543 family)